MYCDECHKNMGMVKPFFLMTEEYEKKGYCFTCACNEIEGEHHSFSVYKRMKKGATVLTRDFMNLIDDMLK